MRTQSLSTNEQYWRDRYGMPPRVEESPAPRRRPLRATRWRRLTSEVSRFRKTSRWRFPIGFPERGTLLKLSAAFLFAIWLAGSGIVLFNGTPADAPAAYTLAARVLPLVGDADVNAPKPLAPKSYDALMADFAGANEASLVALRGFVLTGSEGFKAEWLSSLTQLEAVQTAIVRDSRDWTDGKKLLQLSDLRRASLDLVTQEQMLAGLVNTPNRFPGLRLYNEDVDPALGNAIRLCDQVLQSIMASNWAGTTAGIDTLAQLRGNVRLLREGLASYLPSTEKNMSPDLQAAHQAIAGAGAALAGIRGKVSPADQAQIDRLALSLQSSDRQLQQILALKQTSRWDYADYAFRQKVLPLAEKISGIVGEWRSAS